MQPYCNTCNKTCPYRIHMNLDPSDTKFIGIGILSVTDEVGDRLACHHFLIPTPVLLQPTTYEYLFVT